MDFKIIADYHTHTNMARGRIKGLSKIFSQHAKGTIRENANVALKKGLKEIAITDHGYMHIFYGMSPRIYKIVRNEIDEINQYYKENKLDFKILLGAECNIISRTGEIDINDEILQYLDILCAGYHKGAITKGLVRNNYTEATIKAILKYDITVLHHPCEYVKPDIIEIGEAAASRNTALEINESHFGHNIKLEDIKKLKKLGVKFSLGSDSHISSTIGDLKKVKALALKAGLTNDDIINANGKAHKKMKRLTYK